MRGEFEGGIEAIEFLLVESELGFSQRGFFLGGGLSLNELGNVGQVESCVETGVEHSEIGFDLAGLHEVNASKKDAIDVEQSLHCGLFLQEVPLSRSKMEIVIAVVASDAAARKGFQLFVFRRGTDDERRIELLENVAIFLEKEEKEFFCIVRNEIDFESVADSGTLDGVRTGIEANDIPGREDVHAAKIIV